MPVQAAAAGALAAALVVGFLTPILHHAAAPPFPAVGSALCLAPFPSHRAHLCALPAASPDTLQARGTLPARPRGRLTERSGQITKDLDPAPRHECQGRGDLASHLFFLGTKHAFKSQSRFTGKGWELLGAGQLPQFWFPTRPLSQPCSLHVVQTLASRMHHPASSARGAASRGPHQGSEAAGAAAKLPIPASICSRVALLERGARV